MVEWSAGQEPGALAALEGKTNW